MKINVFQIGYQSSFWQNSATEAQKCYTLPIEANVNKGNEKIAGGSRW